MVLFVQGTGVKAMKIVGLDIPFLDSVLITSRYSCLFGPNSETNRFSLIVYDDWLEGQ